MCVMQPSYNTEESLQAIARDYETVTRTVTDQKRNRKNLESAIRNMNTHRTSLTKIQKTIRVAHKQIKYKPTSFWNKE